MDVFDTYYYDQDHLGNIRQVTDKSGKAVQTTDYYPFGMQLCDGTTSSFDQKHKYNGKELDKMHGLNTYDYGARQYNPVTARWDRMDPLCEKYYSVSPYVYCVNNPIKFIDPDGKRTYVADNGDGTYRVVGGKLDKNRNIYLCTLDKNGKISKIGKSIGKSLTTLSFYNSDSKSWAMGSIINPNDKSGQNFLNKMEHVTLGDYVSNAKGKEPYDFKTTNGTNKVISQDQKYIYRGMKISSETEGSVYASARDVGNYAAGMVAAHHGTTWGEARLAFDALESHQKGYLTSEGMSTQLAQSIGFNDHYNFMITAAKQISFFYYPRTTIISTWFLPF